MRDSAMAALKNSTLSAGAFIVAVILLVSLFAANYYWAGGYYNVFTDGLRYMAAAEGKAVELPFNTRIVVPLVARALMRATSFSALTAVQCVTVATLLASLLVLARLLVGAGVSSPYFLALAVGWGAGLALYFGRYPTFIDSSLLLESLLFVAALTRKRLRPALFCVCLAALTKEYGLLLVIPWALAAYRTGGWSYAIGIFLPVGLLGAVWLYWPVSANGLYVSAGDFIQRQLAYHTIASDFAVLRSAARLWYFAAWGAAWPLLLISVVPLVAKLAGRMRLTMEEQLYLAALCALPFLLTADWDRSFLMILPFTFIAAMHAPPAADLRFLVAFAMGGLSTAFWRMIDLSGVASPYALAPLRWPLIIISGACTFTVCYFWIETIRASHGAQE